MTWHTFAVNQLPINLDKSTAKPWPWVWLKRAPVEPGRYIELWCSDNKYTAAMRMHERICIPALSTAFIERRQTVVKTNLLSCCSWGCQQLRDVSQAEYGKFAHQIHRLWGSLGQWYLQWVRISRVYHHTCIYTAWIKIPRPFNIDLPPS